MKNPATHDEPDNGRRRRLANLGGGKRNGGAGGRERMTVFEYAVACHVNHLEEERKKRKLNPAEERFLRITDGIVSRIGNHETTRVPIHANRSITN